MKTPTTTLIHTALPLLLLGTTAALGQGGAMTIFEPVAGWLECPDTTAPWVARARTVTIRPEALDALQSGNTAELQNLAIKLFDDVTVTPIFKHFAPCDLGGFAWTGGLEDHGLSSFNLGVYDGVMAGEFTSVEAGSFMIRHAGDGVHFIYEVDPTQLVNDGPAIAADGATGGLPFPQDQTDAPSAAPDGGDAAGDIDVMIVYTPNVRQDQGGHAGVRALIIAAVGNVNYHFANSQLGTRVRLVRFQEVAYNDTGDCESDLYYLNGTLDYNRALRGPCGADLLTILVRGCSEPWARLGFQETSWSGLKDADSAAHTLVVQGYATSGTLAHEWGHNLGCAHHEGNGGSAGIEPWARGYYLYNGWWFNTCMAYQTGLYIRIPYFSHPNIWYGAAVIGDANHRNAHLLSDSAPMASQKLGTVVPDGIWVDVSYAGTELGTWVEPYNTVQEGLNAVPTAGILAFKPGTQRWTGTINRAMTIRAWGGTMTIGK